MGAQSLPLFTSTPSSPLSSTPLNQCNPKSPISLRCTCIRSRPDAGPRHNSNFETSRSQRSEFSIDDDVFTDDVDGFGFGSSSKRREWWADEMADIDDGDEEFWIIKVLKAFGWMVPAVGLSMLLGTGTNTLFMAIALPLGQSVLSFAMDNVWGKTNKPRTRPRPQSRSKKKPFTKPASNFTTREERRYEQERASRRTNEGTFKNGNTNTSSKYGGWDELENQSVGQRKQTHSPIQNIDGLEKGTAGKGKLSRRGRNRETPLLVRLLIAVFPFLGSWTRLML